MSAARREGGEAPDMTTREGRRGLTRRREERGLPTGEIRPCGFCGARQPAGATHCEECGAYMRSDVEAGRMNESDGLGL